MSQAEDLAQNKTEPQGRVLSEPRTRLEQAFYPALLSAQWET